MNTHFNHGLRFSALSISQTRSDATGKKEAGLAMLTPYLPFGEDTIVYNFRPVGKSEKVGALTRELKADLDAADDQHRADLYPPFNLGTALLNLVRKPAPVEVAPLSDYVAKAYDQFMAKHPRLNEELADAVDQMVNQEVPADMTPVKLTHDEIKGVARHILTTGNKQDDIAWHVPEPSEV